MARPDSNKHELTGGERLTLTEHGEPCAEIIPIRKIDHKQALADLIDIGSVDFLPRL
jgi:antitoxin (DNA-binding transcriptional repressor) of toxin-antitoxin stability system